MTQQFLGQIQPLAFSFPPKGWAQCDGQILNVAQNAALFSLLGTMYGGNGTTTFALPDLRGRAPMHFGNSMGETFIQGQAAGAEQVTLSIGQMPSHNHALVGAGVLANSANPVDGGALANIQPGSGTPPPLYGPPSPLQPLNPAAVSTTGGTQAHSNIQPYLAVNWCIALVGIFPSRN